VPTRQCVACKTRAEKFRLMRFVHDQHGWKVDTTGRSTGRGAYLCSPECGVRVSKNKRYRALAGVAAEAPWR
jgi:predicted RNA-binding protein YlxR (DUF448 family)